MPANDRTRISRSCRLCGGKGKPEDMVQLKQQRFAILKKWYPNDIKNAYERVHKACLAHIGLHPFPTDVDLNKIIGDRLHERIHSLVGELPSHRGPMQLAEAVLNRIRSEIRVPSVEGHRHLRYMIAHWVTTRLPDGRGGVSTAMDPVVPLDNADVIDVLDPSFCLSDWFSDPSVQCSHSCESEC
jgi:hypothetical protein